MTRRIFAKLLVLTLLALPVLAEVVDGSKAVTTAGVAEALAATTTGCVWLVVQAEVSNTGSIFVGASTVASGRGVELEPGDSMTFAVIRDNNWYDLLYIYVDSAIDGDGVAFTYFAR